jgi:hypothetical protein
MLHQEPLMSEGALWMDGSDLFDDDLGHLRVFAAELSWAWTAERSVEAQHRKVKQRGYSAPNHSEPYQSYGLRRAELVQLLDSDPDALGTLAQLVQNARSAQSACRSLGLGLHPCALAITTGKNSQRDKEYVKIIYHSDAKTLYGKAGLHIAWRPDADHGGYGAVHDEAHGPAADPAIPLHVAVIRPPGHLDGDPPAGDDTPVAGDCTPDAGGYGDPPAGDDTPVAGECTPDAGGNGVAAPESPRPGEHGHDFLAAVPPAADAIVSVFDGTRVDFHKRMIIAHARHILCPSMTQFLAFELGQVVATSALT